MKLIPRMVLLSLMLFILFSQPVSGQEEDRTDDVLVISGEQEKYHVGRYLEILRDSSGELTIQEVASKRYEDQWFTSQAETPNFGFQTVPYWVRFRVRNQSEQNHHWVLAQGFSNMHYMDLYIPEADGEDFSIVKNGVFSGTEILNSPFSYLSFNLEISPGSEKIYYLRFQNTASMTLPLTLWEPEAYQQHIFWNQIGLAAYYAILLVISVYNAFFFFNLREKEYLYLFLFSVGVLIKDFVYDGMIAMFIPAISPTFAIYLLLISLGTYDFAYVKFIDSFLNLKKQAPKIHLAANFIAYLFLLFGFSGIFLPYNLTANLLLLPALVITILIFITILYFLIKGQRSAWYLLISQVFFLLGGLFLTSTRLGVIPSNFFTEQLQRLGLVWMALVWSLALANRMNTLKNEAEASQRQVEENERRLAQYLDSMPFGVVVYNADDKLRYINRQSLNMLSPIPNGLSLDQIMQSSLEEASHFLGFKIQKTNQPYPMDQLPFTEAIQQKKPVYIDDLTINLGDQSIPLEVWSNPLMADSGEFMGVVIAFQNIQDRLLKEDLLRRSEEIRQKILEGSIIGTWMNDLISGEVIWDARTREIFGLAPDEPATLELGLNLVHPEDHQTAEKAFEQALSLQSDGSYEEEKRIIRSDGQIRWIATRGNVIYEDGPEGRHPTRIVGIVIDVTQSKKAEKELEESRIQYQNLVETMNEGLAIVDENLILTYVNPRLPEMLGYTQDEMIGSHVNGYFDSDNFSIVAAQFENHQTGQEQTYTVTFLRKNGTELHSLVAPAVVFDEQDQFLYSIAIISDITEQVKANQLLDMRMAQRTQEIASLMEVSHIIVDQLTFENQLKKILEKLSRLIQYTDASVFLCEENEIISESFQLQIADETAEKLIQPFKRRDLIDARFWHGEALILPNILGESNSQHEFLNLTKSILGSIPPGMTSWIGLPIKSQSTLIGVLSAHAAEKDFFTHEMAELMQAFANQVAIIFEKNRLTKQAQYAAAASERDRLARELHDSVTQSLYSVRLYAEAVRAALKAGKLPAAEKNLDDLIAIARDGMSNLRLLIFELRPPVLKEMGLLGSLQKRLEMVESRSGIQAELNVVGEPDLPEDIETQLYWVLYEALSNVLKHARANNVSLNFDFSEKRSVIILQDDGIGFDPTRLKYAQGGGLRNLIDRVESIGGTIEVKSARGEGTFIRIVLEKSD